MITKDNKFIEDQVRQLRYDTITLICAEQNSMRVFLVVKKILYNLQDVQQEVVVYFLGRNQQWNETYTIDPFANVKDAVEVWKRFAKKSLP